MLPIYQSQVKELMLLQTVWASQINPILQLPLSHSLLLQNISLVSGNNTINHKLGRNLTGWLVSRMQDGFIQLYDLQNTNQMKDLTLILNSSDVGIVDLIVF